MSFQTNKITRLFRRPLTSHSLCDFLFLSMFKKKLYRLQDRFVCTPIVPVRWLDCYNAPAMYFLFSMQHFVAVGDM